MPNKKLTMTDFEIDLPENWKDQGMITITLPSPDEKVRPNIIVSKERPKKLKEIQLRLQKIKQSIQSRGIQSFEIVDERDVALSGVPAKMMICRWDLSAMKNMMGPNAKNMEHIKPGQMVQQIQVSCVKGETAINITASFPAEQFDILHFQEPWVPDLGRQLLSRSSATNIATFHAALPPTAMSRSIERVAVPYTRSALKYLDTLVAVSDAAAAYVRSLTDQPISLIPNGIDLTKYAFTVRKPKAHKQIVYIGRLEKRKGVRYLIDAARYLQEWHENITVLIAGDGPLREQLTDYAADQGVAVEFLGYISEARKVALLQTSDLFVSPALHGESFGIVLLEAMACGIPVIAGDNPGYRSVMQGVGQLSLVSPRHAQDMARRMELFLYTPQITDVWVRWAKAYVKQFDYNTIIDAYQELYVHAAAAQSNTKPVTV